MAAANATLNILGKKDTYTKLEATAAVLEAGLTEAAKAAAVPVTINRVGSIMSCFFTDRQVRNFADVQSTNIKQFKTFFAEMLKQGIYLAPSAFEAMFVSLAHTKKDVEKTIEAAKNSFRKAKDST
jgi:glutamate-1-semialdehyde 2,1-aminomutase